MRIGLLEDDIDIIEIISLWMEDTGNHIVAYTSGKRFRESVPGEKFDMLVLDWNLPDTTGLAELKWLRGGVGSEIPVIFITSRNDEESIVEALDNGADDYMIKPVNKEVTLARINALYRRNRKTSVANVTEDTVEEGAEQFDGFEVYEPYEIDSSQRSIYVNGEMVKLTNKEFELAAFMFRNESSLISRDYLLEYIWGKRADLNTRTVDTHISRIRSKLGINADVGWQLNSVYQCGYRLFRVH